MSIIPKINIGAAFFKKSQDNLSFDCQTTANIGAVQPTMCRELIPNEKVNVKNRTLVRLASMPVPTFGRLSQRDYFTYVRMSDMYEPWAEFLSGQPFTPNSGSTFTPTKLPFFYQENINDFIVKYSYSFVLNGADPTKTYTIDNSDPSWYLALLNKAVFGQFSFVGTGDDYSIHRSAPNYLDPFSFGCPIVNDVNGQVTAFTTYSGGFTYSAKVSDFLPNPSYENADVIIYLPKGDFSGMPADGDFDPANDGIYLCFKFKPIVKHLRQIMIGCGYQFNPFTKPTKPYNPYKLFGFYKSWFDLMRPQRDVQFTNTNCYKCMKTAESTNAYSFYTNSSVFNLFLYDLAFDTYYYTQPDYFSMAIQTIGDSTANSAYNLRMDIGSGAYRNLTAGPNTLSSDGSSDNLGQINSSLLVQGMMKLLRFTSKNNVIGRSLREYAKVHFGIDDLECKDKSVYKIGATRCDIAFDEVMANAATAEANLGEYGGKGIGFNKSESFDFESPDFGYLFCLSVVVPESGYYQGYLQENCHLDRFHFWHEEFDALGYQILERGEIKDDFEIQSPNFNPGSIDCQDGFGFIPRYSEIKVGRNIINGDLTLRSARAGLEGYYLDKRFPSIKEVYDDKGVLNLNAPDYLPSVISQQFRKLDPTDNVGNYNRIFNYTFIDADHFVLQKVFDVHVSAPWKSLSNSFDTIQEGEKVIERSHQ